MRIQAALLLGALPFAALAACSIYDPSLVGTGGSTATSGPTSGPGSTTTTSASASSGASMTTTTTTTSASSGMGGDMSTGVGGGATTGTGGPKPCGTAAECPGADSECATRTCKAGVCGVDFAPDGKALAAQTAKDCLLAVCDGAGANKTIPDDTDTPDDANDCTTNACAAGAPKFTPLAVGAACTMGGGKHCSAASKCVECVADGDCASSVCDPLASKCAPASCGDGAKNGSETDLNCGGPTCPKCVTGKMCAAGTDCVGGACTGNLCAATCTDGLKNNGESDVDCGGASCAKCAIGGACAANTDCLTGNCEGNACFQNHLVINEIDYDQVGTDSGEFVEIYNGTGVAIDLASYALVLVNGTGSVAYLTINLGSAGTLAAGGYLVVGTATVNATAPAAALKINFALASDNIQNGAPDGVALVNTATGMLIDALSYEGSITAATLAGVGTVSLVEGTAFATADSNTKNGSLSRLPNGGDTNNAAGDWVFSNTPTPGATNVP